MNDWTAKALAYLEERKVAGDWKARGLLARRDCPREAPAKRPAAAVVHHAKARRQEETETEACAKAVIDECLARSWRDHRGMYLCEACHQNPNTLLPLEPHHLILGSREDRPDAVMLLCAGCHRLGPKSAHRAPRWFALEVVIPWARAHGYELPNRKEYRDA